MPPISNHPGIANFQNILPMREKNPNLTLVMFIKKFVHCGKNLGPALFKFILKWKHEYAVCTILPSAKLQNVKSGINAYNNNCYKLLHISVYYNLFAC
jgi:hypothetical protein